ncbi:MAG TPA: SH3 domain-containing protein [Haliangiales bacterium]|nr:SH3 domain-containing protein [Haliangiales bacterium]
MPRAVLVLAAMIAASGARADTFVRVITQEATIRTGPGGDFRAVKQAERGQVFEVAERGTRGYWLRVQLDDGTSGWVFGEQVATFEVTDEGESWITRALRSIRTAILGPSPVPESNVELSFSAGVLGGEGLFLFRPAWLIDPYWAVEGFIGQSPAGQEDLIMGGLGWTLRLAPGAALGPFLHASMGAVRRTPKADVFTIQPKTQMVMDFGGGFEVTFRGRITLRADYRHWVLFDETDAQAAEEFTGGLAVFF